MTSRSTFLPLITLAEKLQMRRKKPSVTIGKVCLFPLPHSPRLHPISIYVYLTISPLLALLGILELTHNHGTETLEATPYHSGNSDPKGFGHIAITVDDVTAACARFERLGVPFKKRLTDGKMKEIAFILDPDGYWIEVVRLNSLPSPC